MSKTSLTIAVVVFALSGCAPEGVRQTAKLDALTGPDRGPAQVDVGGEDAGGAVATPDEGSAGAGGGGGAIGGGGGSGGGSGGTTQQSTVSDAGPDSSSEKQDVIVAVGPDPGPDAPPDVPQAPEVGPDVSVPDLPPWLTCWVRENIGCPAGQGCYVVYEKDPVIGNVLKAGCHTAGSGGLGSPCGSGGDLACAPGYSCRGGGGTYGCFPACSTIRNDCPSGMTCVAEARIVQQAAGELDLGVCR